MRPNESARNVAVRIVVKSHAPHCDCGDEEPDRGELGEVCEDGFQHVVSLFNVDDKAGPVFDRGALGVERDDSALGIQVTNIGVVPID